MKINWRVLLHTLHIIFLTCGVAGFLGFFAGLHPFWFAVFAVVFVALVTVIYLTEIRFREMRLQKGWYL